jgi:hypothetical protein
MLGADLVVGAVQGVLDVADDGVEPAEVLELEARGPAAGDHRLMLDASGGHPAKTGEAVVGRGPSGADGRDPCCSETDQRGREMVGACAGLTGGCLRA